MRQTALLAAVPAARFAAPRRRRSELFGGLLAHDVDTPLDQGRLRGRRRSRARLARRADRRRSASIGAPSPYAFASVATGGGHPFRRGRAQLADRRPAVYLRPAASASRSTPARAIGVDANGLRTDLGSRILFAPELGLGYRFSDRVAIEATWVHLSHAQLFSRQNPGMDIDRPAAELRAALNRLPPE